MNPVEIEEAVSNLALAPFDRAEFPYQFLTAFGNKPTTIQRLRAGATNQSDVPGGVLQRSNIHIATCDPGMVDETLQALRASPKTASAKAKFILATDGEAFQAEDMAGGGTVACRYVDFPDHFGFFLPLAGISTVEQIRESAFDIKATGRLNRLYVELLKDNPDWASRPQDMNHFMARLIFCFFAEDTGIFFGERLFSLTIEQMSARDAADTHLVMAEIFRAMDTRLADRDAAGIKRYANQFPYVNGQLFSGSTDCPRFSKIARSYLLHIGSLDWQKINPDIFGSMIQAVADDEERGSLGMHYTSVPNILKVLNPLFLDDLRAKLAEAGDNPRKLLNLRARMAKIRVFDPACGSGNFLVIAYKEMRAIEAEINQRRGEADRRSDIPLTNFRGIELRDFPAEIARLALIIAEYQCDVTYRGQKEALAEFLPLDSQNWITCGNALRLDWLSICPPTGTGVKVQADDLFATPLAQAEIDFENEGGETYICGNPPYKGSKKRDRHLTEELGLVLSKYQAKWKDNDYVAGWLVKCAEYLRVGRGEAALVTTNSITQGSQVPLLWPTIFSLGTEIGWAHTSFRWSNLASNKAVVTVAIVNLRRPSAKPKFLYSEGSRRECAQISPYLIESSVINVEKQYRPRPSIPEMKLGNMPYGAGLLLDGDERNQLISENPSAAKFLRPFAGGEEFLHSKARFCLWIDDEYLPEALESNFISTRIGEVKAQRLASTDAGGRKLAERSHQFRDRNVSKFHTIVVPRTSSENRDFIPVGIANSNWIFSSETFVMLDAPLWSLGVTSSRIHVIWISTVCGKMKTDLRYSNTLGWNTFPIPTLTDQNKADLTRCAEDILLAREAHFPATIADLYDPEAMPADLRAAHERNDEVLERIYIGRRFKNDTERLEKLFELYTKMTAGVGTAKKRVMGVA